MKEYSFSLIIITDKSIDSPQTLSEKLNLNKVVFKRKQWASKKREPKNKTYWILYSELEDTAPPEDHLNYIKDCLPNNFRIKLCDYILDIYISIGVFHDLDETFSFTLSFPTNSLSWFYKFYELLKLEISYYPAFSKNV